MRLNDRWNLFFHDPYDKSWDSSSFITIISKMEDTEQLIAINETIPEMSIKGGMLFLFREGIQPLWEDPRNRNGGYFSFKIDNQSVRSVWKLFVYALCGETLFKNSQLNENVNGISISPKKNFCIIKIWMSVCEDYENAELNVMKNVDRTTKFTPFSEAG